MTFRDLALPVLYLVGLSLVFSTTWSIQDLTHAQETEVQAAWSVINPGPHS
jgi:hypothetical protein